MSLLPAGAADGSTNLNPRFAGELLGEAGPPSEPLSLWYRRPAAQWVEALAIGNGRLGAMVFGGIERERLQLNEDTLWAAGPYDPSNTNALAALPEARRLIFAGRYLEAEKFIHDNMMARPLRKCPTRPVGDLILDFPEVKQVENYRRDLNLDTAVARVRYTADGVTFTREIFASPVDQVIVLRLTADRPGPGLVSLRVPLPANQRRFGGRPHPPAARGEPGAPRDSGCAQVRGRRPRAGGRRQDHRGAGFGFGGRRGLGHAADRRRHQLPELPGRERQAGKDRDQAAPGRRQETICRPARRARGRAPAPLPPGAVGPGCERCRPAADRRADQELRARQRPATGGALLPVWPLPADLLLAPRRPARQPAGPLEREHDARPGTANTPSTSTRR